MAEPTIRQKITQEYEERFQVAMDMTPDSLKPYLTRLPQRVKVSPAQSKTPDYMSVDIPYMPSKARILWAISEASDPKQVSISTRYIDIGGQWLAQATVETPRGTATGHASIQKKEFPLEDCETSAVGRALEFLGYGLYPTGLEEDTDHVARAERESQRPNPNASFDHIDAPKPEEEIPENIKAQLREQASKFGWSGGETEAFIDKLKTVEEAHRAYRAMRDGKDPRMASVAPIGSVSKAQRGYLEGLTKKLAWRTESERKAYLDGIESSQKASEIIELLKIGKDPRPAYMRPEPAAEASDGDEALPVDEREEIWKHIKAWGDEQHLRLDTLEAWVLHTFGGKSGATTPEDLDVRVLRGIEQSIRQDPETFAQAVREFQPVTTP